MLKSLRKKPSKRDVNPRNRPPTSSRNDDDSANPKPSTDLLHPDSARSPRPSTSRKQSSHNAHDSVLQARPPSAAGVAGSPERPKRFSQLKKRYLSDPMISSTYRAHAPRNSLEDSDAAPAPTIGVTAPNRSDDSPAKLSNAFLRPLQSLRKRSFNIERPTRPLFDDVDPTETSTPRASDAHISFDEPTRPSTDTRRMFGPPSNSSTKSASSIFKLPTRKKKNEPLFPLPPKVERKDNATSISIPSNPSSPRMSAAEERPSVILKPNGTSESSHKRSPLARNNSAASLKSASAAISKNPSTRSQRSRTGTMTSLPGRVDGERAFTPFTEDSGRNSTASTTLGRNSIAGLRSLTSRLRHPSELMIQKRGSPSSGAPGTPNNDSFSVSQETLVLPERLEGETAGRYYSRLEEEDMPKKSLALVLSKSSDSFNHDVLRSLMRTFKFYEEPMDISLRKFLWEIDLPGEAQQIDRVMTAFAERYHECNPHIFDTSDEAYFVAYSLIILHSDLFNRNNKSKMQRHQYQKNTGGRGIPEEILGYFFDNISYTEFLAQNPDDVESLQRLKTNAKKVRKVKTNKPPPDAEEETSSKLDPYEVILSEKTKLDVLRPSLKDVLSLDDGFNYLGTAERFDMPGIRRAFTHYGILQVISARSRPEAYTSQATTDDPTGASPGLIDIRVAKVGVLWRKDAKRRKTRSKWQRWGAILTSSQLYMFKDVAWAESLLAQASAYYRHNPAAHRRPVIFKPALEHFRFDANVAMADAVALKDTSYTKHKHSFVLARRGALSTEKPQDRYFDELLLADNENEMNDWLAKLNYAASHNTAMFSLSKEMGVAIVSTSPTENARPPSSVSGGASKPSHITTPSDSTQQPLPNSPTHLRQYTLQRRVTALEDGSSHAVKKLNDNLKTARHLQILAPFPDRTRRELLGYGARLSHNIKWSRFDVWRLKCYRDFLAKDLQDGESGDIAPLPMSSHKRGESVPEVSEQLPPAADSVEQVLEEVEVTPTVELPSGMSPSVSAQSDDRDSADPSVIEGIDEAFETPAELLSRSASPGDGIFKLPPLSLSSRGLSANGERDVLDGGSTSDLVHQNSVSSAVSSRARQSSMSESGAETPAATPSSAMGSILPPSDRDRSLGIASPETRKKARRSMRSSLRESRDANASPHHGRHRRGRDSTSSVPKEDTSNLEVDGIPRRGASVTIHGKKASVVTLGSEWANISAEERLRARQQNQTEEQRSVSTPKPYLEPIDTGSQSKRSSRAFPHLRGRSSESALFVDARDTYTDTDGDADADEDSDDGETPSQNGMPGGWNEENRTRVGRSEREA